MQPSLSAYRERVFSILKKVKQTEVTEVIKLIKLLKSESQIFIIGNGGSISTAAHFANDLRTLVYSTGNHYRAICLNDVNSLTCTGNDRGFDRIFYELLVSLSRPNDLVIMLSASGNSPNLVKAVEAVEENDLYLVTITGFNGGIIKNYAGMSIFTKSEIGSYRETEDAHSIICHYIVEMLSEPIV